MKRTSLKKKSKNKIPLLKRKLWKVVSEYIRKRDKGICITCGKFAEGSGYHAGHFIPDSVGGLALRYNKENIFGQCFFCNIHAGGNGAIYARVLEERFGKEYVENLHDLRNTVTKWSEQDYLNKIEEYGLLLNNLLLSN